MSLNIKNKGGRSNTHLQTTTPCSPRASPPVRRRCSSPPREAPDLGAEGRCSGPASPLSPLSPSPRVVATRSGGGCSASPPVRAVAIAEGFALPSRRPRGSAAARPTGSSGRAPARLLFPPHFPFPPLPRVPRACPGRLHIPPGARTEAPRWGGDRSSPRVSVQTSLALLPSPWPGRRGRSGQQTCPTQGRGSCHLRAWSRGSWGGASLSAP